MRNYEKHSFLQLFFFIIKNNIKKRWPIFKRRFCFFISGRWVFRKTSSQTETVYDRQSTLSFHGPSFSFESLSQFGSFLIIHWFLTWGSLSDSPKEPDLRDVGHSPDRGEGEGDGGYLGIPWRKRANSSSHAPQQRNITWSKTAAHSRELSLESDQ